MRRPPRRQAPTTTQPAAQPSSVPATFVLEDWVDLSAPVPDWVLADERSRPGSIDAHLWLVGQRAWRRATQAAAFREQREDGPAT